MLGKAAKKRTSCGIVHDGLFGSTLGLPLAGRTRGEIIAEACEAGDGMTVMRIRPPVRYASGSMPVSLAEPISCRCERPNSPRGHRIGKKIILATESHGSQGTFAGVGSQPVPGAPLPEACEALDTLTRYGEASATNMGGCHDTGVPKEN